MATNTAGWIKIPDPAHPEGVLQWTGSGGAPMTDAATQIALRKALGFSTPTPIPTGGSSASAPVSMESGGGGGGGGGGLVPFNNINPVQVPAGNSPGAVPYKPGPITTVVNDLLSSAINGSSAPGPGQTLNQMSQGIVPKATQDQFLQNQKLENATITESMGKVGNRFGTDLSRTLADAAGRANVNLSASAMDRALQAIGSILGLGTAQSGLELTGTDSALNRMQQAFLQKQQLQNSNNLAAQGFNFTGGQNALDRANQDFLATSAQNPLMSLLQVLLSGE